MYFTEEIIEKIFEQEIESDNDPVMELENIAADQPALISYLGQENLELLTEEEFEKLSEEEKADYHLQIPKILNQFLENGKTNLKEIKRLKEMKDGMAK